MSAIAGIYNTDGQPADAVLLTRMLNRLAARGPHSQSRWSDGPVGLAHGLLHTTPESLKERHPLSDARGECWLVWDGRLDNREELVAALQADGIALGAETDPELVLQAYCKWDTACFARILGDFAIALWDSRKRRLLCIRDPIGIKPLYYHWDGRRLLFASEVKALLEDPSLVRRPNESMIVDYLLMGVRDPEATFFEGVKQVRPGHFLCIMEGATPSSARHWDVDPRREIRYANEAEYLDQFRDLFRQAVRCRLRSLTPVGILLSGGIDSSAVAAMAATLCRTGSQTPSIEGFTLADHGFFGEEWTPIEALVKKYGTVIHTIRPGEQDWPMTFLGLPLSRSENIHYNMLASSTLTLRPAATQDIRVFLTGFGSDELFDNAEMGFLEDLLRSFRFGRLRREIRLMAKAYDSDKELLILRELLWAQLPVRTRRLVKTLAGRQCPVWVEPSFAARVNLARWILPQTPRRFATLCQEKSYRAMTSPSLLLSLNAMDEPVAACSSECRHPYLDRRLIEFFLSIPSEIKVRGGYPKMFLQRAVQNVSASPLRSRINAWLCLSHLNKAETGEQDALLLRRKLSSPTAPVFRYANHTETEKLQARYLSGERRYGSVLRLFLTLEQWLQDYFPDKIASNMEKP